MTADALSTGALPESSDLEQLTGEIPVALPQETLGRLVDTTIGAFS